MECNICGTPICGASTISGVCSEVCLKYGQGFGLNFAERCELSVRLWKGWSPAERARMDEIVEDIMNHVRNGTGNRFTSEWVERNLHPLLASGAKRKPKGRKPRCPKCGNTENLETDQSVSRYSCERCEISFN